MITAKSSKIFSYLLIALLAAKISLSSNIAVNIGCKSFIESVIIAQLLHIQFLKNGVEVGSVKPLGGTSFVWQALKNDEIQIYPDYTGTLKKEIFSHLNINSNKELHSVLEDNKIFISSSLGFKNGYGIGMKREIANRLGIESISDLKKYPYLRVRVSHEFLVRKDGLKSLMEFYGLYFSDISAMDHTLAYDALNKQDADITEVYLTEGEIAKFDIKILKDDQHFFPNYEAVLVYNESLKNNCPQCIEAIEKMQGSISQKQMIGMNKKALAGMSEQQIAQQFLHYSDADNNLSNKRIKRIINHGCEHLFLVLVSMLFASVVGVYLGILSYRIKKVSRFILVVVSILQTIPSLALLVFMIPFFGIGTKPALVALFLYALLPIVRSTLTGFMSIDKAVIESAKVIGLSSLERLFKVEIPIASRHILSGIKTATVITIGTATLGALIGAGGYGNPILTGIRMYDMAQILEGAIPAALLAIVCQGLFVMLDILFIPKGLRMMESVSQ